MSSKRIANKGKKSSKPAAKKRSSGSVKAAAARKKAAPARPVRPGRPVRAEKPAEAEAKKASTIKSLPEPSHLLRYTKTTSAALGLLEKGIKETQVVKYGEKYEL